MAGGTGGRDRQLRLSEIRANRFQARAFSSTWIVKDVETRPPRLKSKPPS